MTLALYATNNMKTNTIILLLVLLLTPANSWSAESKQYLDSNTKICEKSDQVTLNDLLASAPSLPLDVCALLNLSSEDLKLLRNSIYARFGYIFKDPSLIAFFEKIPWYKKNAAFSSKNLSKLQQNNIETIRLIENIVNMKKQRNDKPNRDFEDIDHPNFQKISDFLFPITSLPQQHNDVEFKDTKLLFKKTKETVDLSLKPAARNEIHEVINGEPDWRVTEKGILVLWPYSYSGTEGTGCHSEYYAFDGKPLWRSFCPDYVFKKNKNLFVQSHYSGCCGAYAWDFGLFNGLTGKEKLFSCSDGDCQDVLLTYLSQSNELLISLLTGSHQAGAWAYQKSDFWLFDNDGNETVHSEVIHINMFPNESGTPFQISNLIGVIRIQGKKEWLFKFVDNNEVYYLFVSMGKDFRPSRSAVLIEALAVQNRITANVYINDIYKGKTPYGDFIIPGKYRLKLNLQGYQDHEEIIEIKKGYIFQTWPYLQPLSQ